jgi:hypothetical protein
MDKPDILERLRHGVVIGDGGYLLELEKRGYVKAGPFTPEVAVEHPEANCAAQGTRTRWNRLTGRRCALHAK